MNDKKLELQRKKELLEDFKRRKLKREQQKIEKKTEAAKFSSSDVVETHHGEFRDLNDPDEILNRCGLSVLSNKQSLSQSASSCTLTAATAQLPTPSSSSFSISVSSSQQSFHSCATGTRPAASREFLVFERECDEYDEVAQRLARLTRHYAQNVVDIWPHEAITYSKETQTATRRVALSSNESADEDTAFSPRHHSETSTPARHPNGSTIHGGYLRATDQHNIFIFDTLQWEDEFHDADDGSSSPESVHNNNDTDHNKSKSNIDVDFDEILNALNLNGEGGDLSNNITLSRDIDCLQFLLAKHPIVERALEQNLKSNIYFDYSTPSGKDTKLKQESNEVKLKVKKTFVVPDKKQSIVTTLDWSSHNVELLLCTYDNMSLTYEEAASESEALIWNIQANDKTPQQKFISTSLITACSFSPFHPNIIVAGTYSGSLLMWDVRSHKSSPIQRSSLSVVSHVNPIYCVRILGAETAHSLLSISNDGKLCYWSLENLSAPYDSVELVVRNTANRAAYATCFDFQQQVVAAPDGYATRVGACVLGADDGLIHSLHHQVNTANITYNMADTFEDHGGPVTAVSCYRQALPDHNDLSDATNASLSTLFLSSSFDATVKLWSLHENVAPLHTFETNRNSYVYDTAWSPVHPALFASADGSGYLDLWELNSDVEAPRASLLIEGNGAGVSASLNKLKWSRGGGELAVGDDCGRVSLVDVSETLSQPDEHDAQRFIDTLGMLNELRTERKAADKSTNSSYLLEMIR